jgi:hypothetical protein
MAFDRFLIAPFSEGWRTDLRPWLIPDEAFQQLNNAYVFRGRVRKRFGSRLMGFGYDSNQTAQLFSRLRIQVDTTDVDGDASGTVPGDIFGIGQLFSIGDSIYTVYQLGTPAAMLSTDGTTIIASFNTTTGDYVFVGAPAGMPVWFYPAEPVMGLTQYEGAPINNWPAYAFDTQFAYVFAGGFWQRSGTGTTPIWHGTNDQYYWATNWQGVIPGTEFMFVTNFNAAATGTPGANDDPIWYFDGTNWATFQSNYTVTTTSPIVNYIQTARIIVVFKNRLVMLYTIEQTTTGGMAPVLTNTSYPQRARFCHYGSPFSGGPIDAGGSHPYAWLELGQVNGTHGGDGGGLIDAATDEEIVSAEFIKDRLIVYFERSTWELAYTGNQVEPFTWQKLNTELGSEATFSSVPFDKAILTIGNTGVHACNGANVERIDNKIPDYVFEIIDKATGVARVAGIRDYYTEMVYWTFPSTEQNQNNIFSTKILTYNYKSNSWGVNDDSITCWGYFEQQQTATWASTTTTWEDTLMAWDSGPTQAQFRQVIAGNQEGFVFIVSADLTRNADALQITNAVNSGSNVNLTVINHNLNVGNYVYIQTMAGSTGLNGAIFKVIAYIDVNTIAIGPAHITGTYEGGGTLARVSNIGILSKQWNPYVDKGRDVYLARIDFGLTATSDGEVTVDYYPSATYLSMLDEGGPSGTNTLMGNGVLETFAYPTIPLESLQTRLWHPVYFQTDGECVQIFISMSPAQIMDTIIAFSDFQLEGLVLHTSPTSQRLQ